METARDAKIVFERRHEVVALHEQLGRGDVESPSSIVNETGRTVRLKSCRATSFVFCTAWMARTWCCHTLSHRRTNRCPGPADLQGFRYSLNHGHLSLQELVEDLLCRPRDTWQEEGLYLLLEMVRFISLTPEERRRSTVCSWQASALQQVPQQFCQ